MLRLPVDAAGHLSCVPSTRAAGCSRTGVRCPHGDLARSPGDRVGDRGQAGLHRGRRGRPRARAAGRGAVHARALPGHVSRPSVDDPPVRGLRLGRGDERALPLPPRPRARPVSRSPSTCPTQLGYDSDDPRAEGEVGRTGVAIDSLADMETPARGDPARRGLDVDDDQRAGGAPAPPLRARRRGPGRPRRRAARHGAERHPQGVRRPGELHLPAATLDAGHDRPLRVLRRAAPSLEHDLDLGLPHQGGRLDRGAGARLHARERDRLLRGRRRRRALAGRVRGAPLLLLQRPQPLLPGGREVPRGQAALGADHDRSASGRRTRRRRPSASTRRRAGRR